MVGVFILLSLSTLHLKHLRERGLLAERDLRAASAELHQQDALEWRAISGRVPIEDVRARITDSRTRTAQLLTTVTNQSRVLQPFASSSGTAAASSNTTSLRVAQQQYDHAVDSELNLLQTGDDTSATRQDEEVVDPAFETLTEALDHQVTSLSHAAHRAQRLSDAGVLALVLISIAAAAVLQQRWTASNTRRSAERASEARYHALIEHSADLVLVCERGGPLKYLSPSLQRLLGKSTPLRGQNLLHLLDENDRRRLSAAVRDVRPGHLARLDLHLHAPGGARLLELVVQDLSDNPAVSGIVLTAHDITERHHLQQELEHRALHDPLTGLPNRLFVEQRLREAVDAVDPTEIGLPCPASTSTTSPTTIGAVQAAEVPRSPAAAFLLLDLDRFKDVNNTFGHLVGDQLLRQVAPRLRAVLREEDVVARLDGDQFAVLLSDLTPCADALGAPAEETGAGHVWKHGVDGPDSPDHDGTLSCCARAVATRLQGALEEPFTITTGSGQIDLTVEISIGIAVHEVAQVNNEQVNNVGIVGQHITSMQAAPGKIGGVDLTALPQRADIALHQAKQTGQKITVHDPSMNPDSGKRLDLLSDLHRLLHHGFDSGSHSGIDPTGQLRLHYQPKVASRTGELLGAEALLRWHHPDHGLINPDLFIPLAESTGLIGPLTQHVLELAVSQAARWSATGHAVPLAANLSARNLMEQDLPRRVADILARHDLAPHLLKLEVTETAVMTDPERATVLLHALCDLGVTVSLDDFGAGYTSLAQLRNLPLSELKIDRSFITNMSTNPADTTIVASVITLAHNLGLRAVAEGVEDAHTLRTLADYGCDVIQGYHVSRPLDDVAFATWRENYTPGTTTAEGQVHRQGALHGALL